MAAHKTRLTLSLLLCAYAATAAAQRSTPEDVAREHFAALQAEGIPAIVKFMHPDALAQFKSMIVPLFELKAERGQSGLRRATFGESATIEEIRAIAPDEFLRSFLDIIAAQSGDLRLSFDRIEIIGVVPEGAQRHVVARITVGANDLSVTEYEVLTFSPFANTWRMGLTGEMQGLAQALRTSVVNRGAR